MRFQDFRVDVSCRTGLRGRLTTAATVYMPHRVAVPASVIVGYAGAGLTRHYFDIAPTEGYSQARYHVSDGFIFIGCDHLGAGDSTLPSNPELLTYEALAAANHATVQTLLGGLQEGSLVRGLPPIAIDKVIGIGHDMGATVLTVQQSLHRTFDGVAMLGWSAIAQGLPLPDPDDKQVEATLAARQLRGHSDEPSPPWRSENVPACAATMFRPRVVAAHAAAITAPVLIGAGERDAVADPWDEPRAYRGSKLVTVAIVNGLTHSHNLGSSRTELWDRINDFAHVVRPRVSVRR